VSGERETVRHRERETERKPDRGKKERERERSSRGPRGVTREELD